MQRLIHSGDFSVVELSEQELKELKEQRRLTPVPTIKCYYLDIENENGPQRLTIEQATRMVVARHAIAQRPAQTSHYKSGYSLNPINLHSGCGVMPYSFFNHFLHGSRKIDDIGAGCFSLIYNHIGMLIRNNCITNAQLALNANLIKIIGNIK